MGVGVKVAVAVITSGVGLRVGDAGVPNVGVAVAGWGEDVTLAVGVTVAGSGANPTAIKPKQ